MSDDIKQNIPPQTEAAPPTPETTPSEPANKELASVAQALEKAKKDLADLTKAHDQAAGLVERTQQSLANNVVSEEIKKSLQENYVTVVSLKKSIQDKVQAIERMEDQLATLQGKGPRTATEKSQYLQSDEQIKQQKEQAQTVAAQEQKQADARKFEDFRQQALVNLNTNYTAYTDFLTAWKGNESAKEYVDYKATMEAYLAKQFATFKKFLEEHNLNGAENTASESEMIKAIEAFKTEPDTTAKKTEETPAAISEEDAPEELQQAA